MSDSVQSHRQPPTRLPRPWDSPGKNTGVSYHFPLQCRKVKSESEVAQSCPTFSDPMDCSPQAPLSIGFSRQEYWSGSSFPSPGDLSDPGVEPRSPALQADSLLSDHQGSPFFFPGKMSGHICAHFFPMGYLSLDEFVGVHFISQI